MAKVNCIKAIASWQDILGIDNVLSSTEVCRAYESNASGLERSIPVVLMPASTKEVQALVQTANRYGTPLYPISTGKNWGLGSRLPIQDQCAVVELSRMNRIIEVNEEESLRVPIRWLVHSSLPILKLIKRRCIKEAWNKPCTKKEGKLHYLSSHDASNWT